MTNFDDSFIITGGWRSSLESIRRKISALTREPAVYYVGRTSGADPITAMKTRYDDYKKVNLLSRMYAVYGSSSESSTKNMEDDLAKYYYDHGGCLNRVPDKRGRTGSGPYFYVYVATR